MTVGRNKMTVRIKKRIPSRRRVTSSNDALSGLAPLLRVRPELQEFCRFGGDWASPHGVAQAGWAYFHIVTRGQCVIEGPRNSTIRLRKGDVLLLPQGNAHILRPRIRSDRDGTPIGTEFHNAILKKTSLGVGVTTELICGQLHFEEASENMLIAALPRRHCSPSRGRAIDGSIPRSDVLHSRRTGPQRCGRCGNCHRPCQCDVHYDAAAASGSLSTRRGAARLAGSACHGEGSYRDAP